MNRLGQVDICEIFSRLCSYHINYPLNNYFLSWNCGNVCVFNSLCFYFHSIRYILFEQRVETSAPTEIFLLRAMSVTLLLPVSSCLLIVCLWSARKEISLCRSFLDLIQKKNILIDNVWHDRLTREKASVIYLIWVFIFHQKVQIRKKK